MFIAYCKQKSTFNASIRNYTDVHMVHKCAQWLISITQLSGKQASKVTDNPRGYSSFTGINRRAEWTQCISDICWRQNSFLRWGLKPSWGVRCFTPLCTNVFVPTLDDFFFYDLPFLESSWMFLDTLFSNQTIPSHFPHFCFLFHLPWLIIFPFSSQLLLSSAPFELFRRYQSPFSLQPASPQS